MPITNDSLWTQSGHVVLVSDTDMQNNVNDPYLLHSQRMFGENVNRSISD